MIEKKTLAHTSEGVIMPHLTRIAVDYGRVWPRLSFFCFLSLFLLFLNTPVIGGTIELPQTGQTTCYDAAGNPIACGNTGQDGDFIAGVSWPVPRFEVDLSGACITDNLTGLMWSRNAWNLTYQTSWSVSVLNPPTAVFQCGFSDWRLPNINELQSLVNFEEPNNVEWLISQGFFFLSVSPLQYWSSTSAEDAPESNAWYINMLDGSIAKDSKLATNYIWPVRGTSNPVEDTAPVGQIAETGQTDSVATYDDAYYATSEIFDIGVPWPDPRFTLTYCEDTGPCTVQDADCDAESSNNIVLDNLTGLVWSVNANLAGLRTWANALSFANGLTVCGYGDWRLPNSKELLSLVDRSQSEPALPSENPFTNIQPGEDDLYWSSTSYASDPDGVWALGMLDGALGPWLKKDTAFVWPVRGGKTEPLVLTVKKLGNGQGTVAATGLACDGKTCKGEYASYEVVVVTATPKTGSVFTGWGGDACSGITDTTCTITVTANMKVTATFRSKVKISVAPKSLNFKNLKQNIESSSLSVVITNEGVENLTISTIEIAEDTASIFTITSNPADCAVIASDASCTVTITATSPDYDPKTAKLLILSNDPRNSTTVVRLKAKAKPPKIARKPSGLSFGKVAVGVPAEKVLTLTNKGITDLNIGAITIAGDHPGDFSALAADTCSGSTLITDGTCTVTVTFTPSAAGKRKAILQVPSNDPKRSPLIVNLKGTGE